MDAEQKKILKPLCLTLRHLLEGRYDEQGKWHGGDLEERMNALGVWWSRDPIPTAEMPFRTPEDRHAREVIDAYLALREDAGLSRKDAIEEFVREAAYTWANRLLVLRCMEARDLIDGVVTAKEVYGGRSLAHHRLAQRHPEHCTGEDGGLFAMLEEAFSFHAKHLPLLFNPKAPAVALRPSVAALKRCIALLSGTESVNGNGPATDEVFAAPDALGWAYQYWNTEEKDRVFEKVRTKKTKIAGADIIPATQLYTEPYMVKFLVQNSLGATWMGMYPDSDLLEGWEYYVKDADRAPVRRKNVENITFLDPACGSGHFLIEAFDLFYQMYEAEGKYTDPEAICKKILSRNLYGIDIDERAVQIARAALWMKAAERVIDFSGTPKNIIATNIRLPKGKDHLKVFLQKHPEDRLLQPALESIFEGLEHADELGSLLQIEEPVEKELRYLRERLGGQTTLSTGGLTGQTSFAGTMTDEDWEAWKEGVVERLADHFKEEGEAADLTSAFFSQNAGKGVRLFELLSKRYDVVAANPPYMHNRNMGKALKTYLGGQFQGANQDLYAAFIVKCSHLAKDQHYFVMVSQQSFMFISRYKKIREYILDNSHIQLLAHIGPRGFQEIGGEKVNVALIVFKKTKDNSLDSTFFKLVEYPYESKIHALISKKNPIIMNQSDFRIIPDNPFVYWIGKNFRSLFSKCEDFSKSAKVATRTKTANNDRYLRFFWEVLSNKTDYLNWSFYTKGGKSNKWFGNLNYCVRWDDVTQDYFRENPDCRITDEEYRNKMGITYSATSGNGFAARYVPPFCVYDVKGPTFVPNDISKLYFFLGYLNSFFTSYCLNLLNPTLEIQTGDLERIPILSISNEAFLNVSTYAKIATKYASRISDRDPTEGCFSINNSEDATLAEKNKMEVAANFDSEIIILSCQHLVNYTTNLSVSLVETSGPYWEDFDKSNVFDLSLLANYDQIPISLKSQTNDLFTCNRQIPSDIELLKNRLYEHFKSGFGVRTEIDSKIMLEHDFNEVSATGLRSGTFLEKLSQKLQIHPISIYWLLKEGIEQEGWRCIPEERRITTDRFTVMILRMLGHRWPKQIEAGEPVPDWADADGIIPLTSGTGEATLLEQVRARIAEEFPGGSVAAIEREFEEVVDASLEDWLNTGFFKHHTKQFKKRPIAWQVQSGKFTKKRRPAFACMIYYHKLDGDTLHKIKNQYVGPLRQRYETEIRGIEGIPAASRTEVQEQRFRELEGLIAELKAFGETLTDAAENGFSSKMLEKIAKSEPLDSWCSIDGKRPAPTDREAFLRQEKSYIPDINDGVRVNVVPLQKAGLLAGEVIAKKDLEKAISDRAEWRADERRWCREGKLPECGWW